MSHYFEATLQLQIPFLHLIKKMMKTSSGSVLKIADKRIKETPDYVEVQQALTQCHILMKKKATLIGIITCCRPAWMLLKKSLWNASHLLKIASHNTHIK
ncbi:MAG: hypothetical protein CME88_13895 [Hirschia sp.]|nr:hypothetical protein [Hirschia sp.]MBF19189.1 hypothetical protein [Hirschia sp.]MBF19464.1 hypothetical protein [Hirschia sp.]|tara:strand:- start:513 stop:812 length:300 start_codon:yes stop_codon:yes gene_type:complete